jgi:hypothetical protein
MGHGTPLGNFLKQICKASWMRSWLGLVAIGLCAGIPGRAAPVPIDCGPAPTVSCLSAAIFSLAKTLPDKDGFREHVSFAERELAPGSRMIALQYVIYDNPDPPPWEDIDWISRAGRFDRAIELAKQRSLPVERLGGLAAVAKYMLEKNDSARATQIVEEVERALPSLIADDNDGLAGAVWDDAAETLVRLGQTERAARLMPHYGAETVSTLIAIARKYPGAVSLRDVAWQEAERVREPYAFQLLLEDAIARGDQAEISQAALRASRALDGKIDGAKVGAAIELAHVLLRAGFSKLSAQMVEPWPEWVLQDVQLKSHIVEQLVPVLAGLARDRDVQTAINAVGDVYYRSECLGKAAEEYDSIGRTDIAKRFDVEALRAAVSLQVGSPQLQSARDGALTNLALARAGHGDIQGALDVADELGDDTKVLQLSSLIARRAIDTGNSSMAEPAILATEQQAYAAGDMELVLQAAKYWYEVGKERDARGDLASALEKTKGVQPRFSESGLEIASELMWRFGGEGKPQAMLETVDKLQIQSSPAIDHLVDILRPVSSAAAVQLSGRQVDVYQRIEELANIAIQIAEAAKQ